jgi:enoyl-CoA hydratase/carnithine racemase
VRSSADERPLLEAVDEGVLTLTLNRPEQPDWRVAADTDSHSTMLAESLAQAALLATDDHQEGLAAARERREPGFTGR